MSQEIKPIELAGVNCYLIKTDDGYVLIDTGFSFGRGGLKKALEKEGCRPGNLKLIIITHGDFDHTGNCAYLQKKYGTRIAVHSGESEVIETGDMTLSRKQKQGLFARKLLRFFGLIVYSRFEPDIYLEDGQELSEYGLDAKVLHISGHSTGSIGVLTADGDLFCGDLFKSGTEPVLFNIDDSRAANGSVKKLKSLKIGTVYPGHGKPFQLEQFIKSNR
ncbi:MBL fold metallo-hydrolase [Chloroflexota bacterium]